MKDAFPHPEGSAGMSLREYFAAHAPDDIPEWFTHIKPEQDFPPMPDLSEISTDPKDPHRKLALDWQRDPCFDLWDQVPELKWYADEVIAHREGRSAWEDANRRARYFQWRYAYADGMIEQGAE